MRAHHRASSGQFTLEGLHRDARLATSISAGGDIDGDGFGDVLIGVPGAVLGGVPKGEVLILRGSENGIQMADYTNLTGRVRQGGFGSVVSAAGDVNGDGLVDVIIGGRRDVPSLPPMATCFLALGAARGEEMAVGWQTTNMSFGSRFATRMGEVGDIDGDRLADFSVSAPNFTGAKFEEGEVLVFRGGRPMPVLEPAWRAVGRAPGAHFGAAVANAGDVNGDGYNDILIGAPQFSINNLTNQPFGRVELFLGSARGLSSNASWSVTGLFSFGRFGSSLAAAGDINRDGYADFMVGAPGDRELLDYGGMVFVYLGSPRGPAVKPAWAIRASQHLARCGRSVAGVGDVNGDGWPDLLVGSPLMGQRETGEGCAALYLGSASGMETEPSWVAFGGQREARYGWEVAAAGDVNGDGLADFAVASLYYDGLDRNSGRVDFYYGSTTAYSKVPVKGSAQPLVLNAPDSLGYTNRLRRDGGTVGRDSTARINFVSFFASIIVLITAPVAMWWWGRRKQTLATERERSQLARDLHDGLGARIAQLTQSAPGREATPAGQESVQSGAELLAGELDEIVWALNPANDSLEHLVSFLGEHGQNYFRGSAIRFRPDLPLTDLPGKVPAETRRDVAMIVKECFANVLRHARASEVHLEVRVDRQIMTVIVEDNGVGLGSGSSVGSAGGPRAGGGNGWGNIQARADALRGECCREPGRTGGTRVILRFPLLKPK